MKKKSPKTKLVRVDESTAIKVEKFARPNKQSIGGFFTLAAEEKLKKQTTDIAEAKEK